QGANRSRQRGEYPAVGFAANQNEMRAAQKAATPEQQVCSPRACRRGCFNAYDANRNYRSTNFEMQRRFLRTTPSHLVRKFAATFSRCLRVQGCGSSAGLADATGGALCAGISRTEGKILVRRTRAHAGTRDGGDAATDLAFRIRCGYFV